MSRAQGSKNLNSARKLAVTAALALLASMRAEAQSYEPSQVYLLPLYCKYTQVFRDHVAGGNNRAEIDRWTVTMGPSFNHMHHYCWGLMSVNRAMFSSNRQDRIHELNHSLAEFDYVTQRVPLDFYLLPEILTKRGDSLVQLDRGGEAVIEYKEAVKLKQSYAPAYAAMSDFYKGTGQLAKARETLEQGLAAAPESTLLKRRMADLNVQKSKERKAAQDR
jgi:tetratricopeptide (TPR) repeat protein